MAAIRSAFHEAALKIPDSPDPYRDAHQAEIQAVHHSIHSGLPIIARRASDLWGSGCGGCSPFSVWWPPPS